MKNTNSKFIPTDVAIYLFTSSQTDKGSIGDMLRAKGVVVPTKGVSVDNIKMWVGDGGEWDDTSVTFYIDDKNIVDQYNVELKKQFDARMEQRKKDAEEERNRKILGKKLDIQHAMGILEVQSHFVILTKKSKKPLKTWCKSILHLQTSKILQKLILLTWMYCKTN